MPTLNIPQANFFLLEKKFKAFVGGFGCLHGDSLVITEFGAMPISRIDRPMRVLSWNGNTGNFQWSLTGGSFVKGRTKLWRVVTDGGEFRATGDHGVLKGGGHFAYVKDLAPGDRLARFDDRDKANRGSEWHDPKSQVALGMQALATMAERCPQKSKSSCQIETLRQSPGRYSRINEIEADEEESEYWDLQVLETNNYVTVDGTIHHNSGKTWVGCAGLLRHAAEYQGVNSGYFAPTYAQIRDIFYPTMEEAAHEWGFRVKVKEANKEVEYYSGGRYRCTTICRSMEKPQTIVGFKIGHALVDELDVLPAQKAQHAWRKIIARMRYNHEGLRNGVDVTTTPEGFKFVYDMFVKEVREHPEKEQFYGIVRASTYDNAKNLPDDYIPSLIDSYPAQLIKAYLGGEFVNLTSGTVYHSYDRVLNRSDATPNAGETLHIGMDFNVGKMAAVVHVVRGEELHAVAEIINAYDTPDTIRLIRERFWRYESGRYVPTREIRIYPDASGGSRKSVNASASDIALLREAGFKVIVNAANPPVKDRINAMNALFCNAAGVRRYKVNALGCPHYSLALEQQVWASNGEPDKSQGNDHPNDAGGYVVAHLYPIVNNRVSVKKISGF